MFVTHRVVVFCLAVVGGLGTLLYSASSEAQCSTGAWSSETGAVQAIGVSTNPTGKRYEGDCGLTINASEAPGYVTTDSPLSETLFTARFYFLPDQFDLTSGDAVIFQARNGGVVQVKLSLREVGGALSLVAAYRSGNGSQEYAEAVPLLGTWQGVTVAWSAGVGNGSFSLKLDGQLQFTVGGLDNGSELVNEIDLGIVNNASGSGKLVFDAFEIRRTSEEPPLLALNEMINISTRADVGPGRYRVVGGFIIEGDTKKCVVVRGRGIAIGNRPELEDPTLTLKDPTLPSNSNTIGYSDNWGDHETADTLIALGKAPSDATDAALFICLEPGNYTATVGAATGTATGIGIVEVVDVDAGTAFLGNISTRARVVTGARRAVAGFAIDGDQAKTILIRGRGPTVNAPPNTTLLADPFLELLSDGGSVLETNDNWGQASNAAEISATGAAPENEKESSILVTLQPGVYTVRLSSANGEAGVGIIEVLDLDGGSVEAN